MNWWGDAGRHERPPPWAQYQTELLHELIDWSKRIMAGTQEVEAGLHRLFGVVDTLLTRVTAATTGGMTADEAQSLVDEMNAERQKIADTLAASDVSVPPAPATPAAADGSATPQ
jgi:hypothetical protein